jgi:hypothetical protein
MGRGEAGFGGGVGCFPANGRGRVLKVLGRRRRKRKRSGHMAGHYWAWVERS